MKKPHKMTMKEFEHSAIDKKADKKALKEINKHEAKGHKGKAGKKK